MNNYRQSGRWAGGQIDVCANFDTRRQFSLFLLNFYNKRLDYDLGKKKFEIKIARKIVSSSWHECLVRFAILCLFKQNILN